MKESREVRKQKRKVAETRGSRIRGKGGKGNGQEVTPLTKGRTHTSIVLTILYYST